jgi:hypothetical protein
MNEVELKEVLEFRISLSNAWVKCFNLYNKQDDGTAEKEFYERAKRALNEMECFCHDILEGKELEKIHFF